MSKATMRRSNLGDSTPLDPAAAKEEVAPTSDVPPDRWVQGRTAGMLAERPTRRIVRQEIERDALLASAWAQHRRVPQVPVLADRVQPHGREFVGLIANGHEDVGITGGRERECHRSNVLHLTLATSRDRTMAWLNTP